MLKNCSEVITDPCLVNTPYYGTCPKSLTDYSLLEGNSDLKWHVIAIPVAAGFELGNVSRIGATGISYRRISSDYPRVGSRVLDPYRRGIITGIFRCQRSDEKKIGFQGCHLCRAHPAIANRVT